MSGWKVREWVVRAEGETATVEDAHDALAAMKGMQREYRLVGGDSCGGG